MNIFSQNILMFSNLSKKMINDTLIPVLKYLTNICGYINLNIIEYIYLGEFVVYYFVLCVGALRICKLFP